MHDDRTDIAAEENVTDTFKMWLLTAAQELEPELAERLGERNRDIVFATLTVWLHPDMNVARGAVARRSALLCGIDEKSEVRAAVSRIHQQESQDVRALLDSLRTEHPPAAPWLAALELIHGKLCATRERFMGRLTRTREDDELVEAQFTLAVRALCGELAALAAAYPFGSGESTGAEGSKDA